MAESAQKRGQRLLERFQEEKHSAHKSMHGTPAANRDPQEAYFDSLASGSLLGIYYSESKKKDRDSTPKAEKSTINIRDDNENLEAESPLEMIRYALLQLSTLEGTVAGDAGTSHSISNITSLLQGVEEYLERSNSRLLAITPRKAGKVNTKLGFSAERPTRRPGSDGAVAGADDEVLNQSTYTPIKADQSGLYRTQRSIFMENQLDLNESEMEYYEGIVNDLAEKLERMQEEKDDLQSISNALGERLQRISQQKEEALNQASKAFEEKKAELELRLTQLEVALTAKTQELQLESDKVGQLESSLSILKAKIRDDEKKYLHSAEQNAALGERVSKLTEELQQLTSFQGDVAQQARLQVADAQRQAETLQATVDSLTRTREELLTRVTELERDAAGAAHLRSEVEEARRVEAQLRSDLSALRAKREQETHRYEDEVRELRAASREAQRQEKELQQRLATAESAAAVAASQAKTTSTPFATPLKAIAGSPIRTPAQAQGQSQDKVELEEENAALKEKVEDLEAELDDNRRELDSLSSLVEDLRMQLSGDDRNERSRVPPSARKIGATTPAAGRPNASAIYDEDEGEGGADESILLVAPTPQGKHIDRRNVPVRSQAGQREVHKQYMANQLDLNESELQYYEEVVDELGDQLETAREDLNLVRAEKEELRAQNERLQREADAVGALTAELEAVRAEKARLTAEVDRLALESASRQVELSEQQEEVRLLKNLLADTELRLEEAESHQTGRPGPSVSAGIAMASGHGGVRTHASHEPLSTPDRMTNDLLGLTSVNDDSDIEDGDEFPAHTSAARRRDPSTSFDSFHSTAEHVYHRNDAQELRRIIQEREQQIKVQLAQLQSQQDTLQEHRDAVDVLKGQKQTLKKSLAEATARVEALQSQEVALINRVHQLEEQAQEATELAEDLRRLSSDAEARYEEAKFKVNDLLQVTTEQRLQIEHLQEQQRFLQQSPQQTQQQQRLPPSGLRGLSTPSPPTSAMRSANHSVLESGGSRSESLQQRLRHAEQQVDELSLHIRMVEKTNEEAQLEFDKLQVRFQAKLRLAEQQSQDIMELRQEIDKLLEENDRIKLHEMQTETSCRLREIDNQGEIELLQQRVEELEAENNRLIEQLRAKHHDLEHEIENNRALKELMHRAGEKDHTVDRLLTDARAERDAVRKQLAEVSDKLQVQARTVTEYHEQFAMLQMQLQRRDSEAVAMQKRLELLQGETQGETRTLYLRLEDLSNENQNVEEALREQRQKTSAAERELKARSAELESSRRSLRHLVDVVRAHYSKLLNAQDALSQTVQSKLARLGSRLDSSTDNVEQSLAEVANVMSGSETDRRLVERALQETQALLQKALDQHERDATEKDEIWAKYEDAQQQVGELQGLLDEVNAQLEERVSANQDQEAQAQAVQEEVGAIHERLSEAELRAEQMSTESARAFAKSARTIAYLEGECTRLRTLLDHLRVVNAKLNGDLKEAHLEGMRCKSLEHRVKMSEQDEAALRKRIEALEAAVQQKEQELLEALEAAREQEEERLERFESEYNAINSQFRALQEKNAALLQEHAALKDATSQGSATQLAELETTTAKLLAAQKEVARQQTRAEELDFELRNLRHTLQETEHLYSQANTKIALLTEEARVSKETHANTVRELQNEVRDRSETSRAKDQQLAQLKAQVNRLEADFVQRDEEVAGKLLKRIAADDENRQLRAQLEAQHGDLTLLRGRIEDLQVQVTSLSQEKETLAEQDAHHRAELQLTTVKLQETRDVARKYAEDLDTVQREYAVAQETILSCRSELSETEHKLQSIQTEFFAIQANEQALVAHNESLTADNAYLKKQVDELVPKLSASSREVVSLRGQVNEQTELVQDLRRAAQEQEGRLLQIKSSVEAYEAAEADIVSEMREVAELLASSVGVEPSSLVPAPSHGAAPAARAKHGTHGGMDLFASPPLAVMRSPLNLYSSEVSGGEGMDLTAELASATSDTLSAIKYNVGSLKTRASNLLSAYLKTYESLEKVVKEKEDLRRDFDRAKEKIQLAAYDREALLGKLTVAEETQDALRSQLEELQEHNTAWVNGHSASSQRISTVLREMDSQLLECLAKANDAVAGVVPINTDSLPNLRISEALIQYDEARGRANFHDLVPSTASGSRHQDPDHHSSTAVLTVSVSEVQRATEYLLSTVRSLVRECKHRGEAVHKAESAVDVKEAIWERDRKQFFEQQAELEGTIAALQKQHAHLTAELETHRGQLERANHRVADLVEHNGTLEGELSEALNQRSEVKQDLIRVEATCLDLRGKLRAAQLEVDKRSEDLNAVNEQFEEMQRRITESELNHERLSTLLGRTRAEKDALDNVRRSLESELERSRAEVITLKECSHAAEEEHRTTFEVEKVLAALTTTMDQIVASGSNSAGLRNSLLLNASTEQATEHALLAHVATAASVNSSFVSVDSHRAAGALAPSQLPGIQNDVPLGARVDAAVKRLSSLRHWAREEARAKRILEGQLEAAGADTAAAQAAAEEAQKQVKQLLQSAAQRDKELREKTAELLEREHEVHRLQDELQRLRATGTSITGRLEDEKKHGASLAEQIAAKEHECARLAGELETRNLTVTKLEGLLQTANEQLAAAVDESERRAEQLRVAKSNSERIMATLTQVERGAETDKAEREAAEKRCAEAEQQLSTLSRLRARTAELEQKLTAAKDECKVASRAKVVAEELNTTLQQDLLSANKKVVSLEHRIASIMQEKNSYVDEMAETRRKIALAKQYADQERAQRMKADAAMALLKRNGEESRVDLVEYATVAEEVESLQSRAEEEKRSLRSKISELKHQYDEQESRRLSEMGDRKKLESDIKQLKTALAKRTAELESSSSYSAQLRSEGRHARQLVMHAVKHIREILTAVRADARAAGVDVMSPGGAATRAAAGAGTGRAVLDGDGVERDSSEVSYDDALRLGLGEALGINDLTESLESLREAMSYISAAPINRHTLQARIAQLETENSTLHKDFLSSETKCTELVSRYKEELQTVQMHITELRRTDSKNPHLMHQISELESAVRQERERREKAQAEIALLRGRLEQATSLQQHFHRPADGLLQAELDAMRSEFEQYRAENAELVQELNAVNHHRTVLRDTIEQLDREVREKVDLLSDLQATTAHSSAAPLRGLEGAFLGAASASDADAEALHRQLIRYKARAAAVDNLATIYRTSVLALYSDGASYGAAQFGSAGHFQGMQLIGVGWIEREMTAVKHSYEDEVRLLDAEVSELRAKQRQSTSYIHELQRRFEENMRSLYRSGKLGNAEGLPLEQVQRELDSLQTEVHSLQQELTAERLQGRNRHSHLVETLTMALQARDAALGALKRLEDYCQQRGVEINGLAVYESLKEEMAKLNPSTQLYDLRAQHTQQQQVVDTLMRGLVEADHELAESERRQRARQRAAAAGTTVHTATAHRTHSRSSSRGRDGASHQNVSHSTYRAPTTAAVDTPMASTAVGPVSMHMPSTAATASTRVPATPVTSQTTRERHQSPAAMRVHYVASPPSIHAHHHHHSSTTATATTARDSRTTHYTERSTSYVHEQRLTEEFLTRTSPNSSPAGAAATGASASSALHTHTAPAASTARPSSVPTTQQAALSTSGISQAAHSTRMRSTVAGTQREASFQLPVTSLGAGSASLRVSRSSTPVSSAMAGATQAGSALGASRRVARGPTTDAR